MKNKIFIFFNIFFLIYESHGAIRVSKYDQLKQSGLLENKTTSLSNLPVEIDAKIAKKIESGDKSVIDMTKLTACSEIYPEGKFAWTVPDAGVNKKIEQTCVSIVEMRAIKGTEDIVLAKAHVAAGDSVVCNIDKFPESGYTQNATNIEFPADNPPTIEDVEKVMDEEQKQNAVFKIVTGAIVGGVTGNMAGKSKDGSMFGTNNEKMKTSAIGALSGAAVMAGNAYTGKVAGDVIMSTGINAAAGGVIGNVLANGESILKVEDCTIDGRKTRCLWGILENVDSEAKQNEINGFYNLDNGRTMTAKLDSTGNFKDLDEKRLIIYKLENGKENFDEDRRQAFLEVREKAIKYFITNDKNGQRILSKEGNKDLGTWVKIDKYDISGGTPHPVLIPDFKEKNFGTKLSDWYLYNKKEINIYERKIDGNAGSKKEGDNLMDRFYPVSVNADEGNVVDISNKARLKETLIGSGVGAGLGALSGYQGAKNAIEDRWASEVQQYKDSLQKIYCGTGKRFLSHYNDTVIIPNIRN